MPLVVLAEPCGQLRSLAKAAVCGSNVTGHSMPARFKIGTVGAWSGRRCLVALHCLGQADRRAGLASEQRRLAPVQENRAGHRVVTDLRGPLQRLRHPFAVSCDVADLPVLVAGELRPLLCDVKERRPQRPARLPHKRFSTTESCAITGRSITADTKRSTARRCPASTSASATTAATSTAGGWRAIQ